MEGKRRDAVSRGLAGTSSSEAKAARHSLLRSSLVLVILLLLVCLVVIGFLAVMAVIWCGALIVSIIIFPHTETVYKENYSDLLTTF